MRLSNIPVAGANETVLVHREKEFNKQPQNERKIMKFDKKRDNKETGEEKDEQKYDAYDTRNENNNNHSSRPEQAKE